MGCFRFCLLDHSKPNRCVQLKLLFVLCFFFEIIIIIWLNPCDFANHLSFDPSYVGVELLGVTIGYRLVMGIYWAVFFTLLSLCSMGLNITTTHLGKQWFIAISCGLVAGVALAVAAQLRGFVMVRLLFWVTASAFLSWGLTFSLLENKAINIYTLRRGGNDAPLFLKSQSQVAETLCGRDCTRTRQL
jgi:hypothetical protein